MRAAKLWPERAAVSVLPDAEHFHTPLVQTFAELARDVHRAAAVLAGLGVGRGEAVAVLSVNCAEMLPLLLAAEAVGIYAPINPSLAPEHAIELLRLSRAKVIVASGPELDEGVWLHARTIAERTGAHGLVALRPTAASGQPPALEPLDGVEVAVPARSDDRRRRSCPARRPPDGRGHRQLSPYGRHDRHAEACGTHARQRGFQRLDDARQQRPRREQRDFRRVAAVPHQRAVGDRAGAAAQGPARRLGRARSATATSRCSRTSGRSSSATGSRRCPPSPRSMRCSRRFRSTPTSPA